MTIIVYRSGVLASDSCMQSDSYHVGDTPKIARSPNGWVGGFAGKAAGAGAFFEWMSEPVDLKLSLPDFPDGCCALLISPTREKWYVEEGGYFQLLGKDFAVMGSGEPVALGALEMGATAIEAVETAIKYCDFCEGPIQTLRIDE